MNSPIHTFEHKGKTYKVYPDEMYETRGSYAYGIPDETKAAEDEELEKLNNGDWIAIGISVEEPCVGVLPVSDDLQQLRGLHCDCCREHGSKVETNSCWGIVIEDDPKKWEQYIKDGGF